MTSLPSSLSRRTSHDGGTRSAGQVSRDLATRRPFVATATLGGAFAAVGPVVVCMAVAVVGWFLTDAGGHGEPSDALRVGASGWLLGHGSGLGVGGVRITAVPLGLTLLCAWVVWRVGHRVGEAVSGHGPDAARLADGERDWTVPTATVLFTAGYVIVASLTASTVATAASDPNLTRVIGCSILLGIAVGGPAIARGSGRAAIWVPALPAALRAATALARTILLWWLAASALAFGVAFVLDLSTAANVVSQLGAGTGDTALIALLSALVVPNAVLFSSSYLLGPGFTVGTGTLVSPGLVVLGPLPMFPLLAALPDPGTPPAWTEWLMLAPLLVAFVAAARWQRRSPAPGWDQVAIRGCGGGILAGVLLGLLTLLAGGAVGPGRMSQVGPFASDVLLHSMTAFGFGGLLGALAMAGWQRRGPRTRGALGSLRGRLPGRG
ncbi:hypothetical protein E8D34_11295 [Nocardioides sp. GY 10113]|uniref:cell division protein PerM n=1 Tax=Nocardioides sp. GY 10113 TaxID=2569761 RepID=UPI0010A76F6E|nr:DUF6350 family protein [Nocardioides sp. GY 10113]TIC86813.1 hypothetical protein E8D34_11295 [Nocardioides sp. GY 10113]